MELVVQYIPDCPNEALMLRRLEEALALAGLSGQEITVQLVEAASPEAARGFHGSPTLLVNGVDPFAGNHQGEGYTCRVYETDAGIEGAPSLEQLLDVLAGTRHAS